MEDGVVVQGSMLPIHILRKNGKKWILNPHPNDINSLFELWVYENKHMDHLLWDLGEWKWQIIPAHGILGKQIPFSHYFVKVSRELPRRGLHVVPPTYKFLRYGNVQDSWLGAYWKLLWAMQIPKKIVMFRWLLVHYGIPLKSWMWGHRHDLKCGSCVFILNMFTVSYGYVLFLEQFGKEG